MDAFVLNLLLILCGGFCVLFMLFMLLIVTLFAIAYSKWPDAADRMTPAHIVARLWEEHADRSRKVG